MQRTRRRMAPVKEEEIRIPSQKPASHRGMPPVSADRSEIMRRSPVSAEPPANTAPLYRRKFGRPGAKDWYLFSLELRTMVGAGIPLVQALSLLEKNSERHRVKVAAAALGRTLAARHGIEKAVGANDDIPQMIKAMLVLGSRAGRVVEILELVVRHYQWMLDIRSQILRAIWYPAALVILGALIMVGRETALAVLTGRMPLGNALLYYTWIYYGPIIIGAALAVVLATAMKLRQFRPVLDRVVLTTPLLGMVAKKYSLAVFFEVFSACIEAGMPINMAYDLASRSTPNAVLAGRLEEAIDFLRDGESIGETLRQSGVLDAGSLGMVRAGESAAEAPFLMRKLAAHETAEVQLSVRLIIKVALPLMIPLVAIAYFADATVLGWLAFALTFLLLLI